MKVKLTYEADFYDDYHEVVSLINFRKYERIINECEKMIRNRLKFANEVSEKETAFLEELRRTLYIDDEID